MTKYPTKGFTLSVRRQRVEATGFASEVDARAAIMEHEVANRLDDYSLRVYTGEGVYVLVGNEAGRAACGPAGAAPGHRGWLTYAA